MSMPAWLNDVSAVSNPENGAFNPQADPNMAFMQTPPSANFDFNQIQNQQQFQQRMQNGTVRNGSPAFHNPLYNTQSVVPSKRQRPGPDMMGASPGQNTGAPPNSRSQTPQQTPYPGFHGNVNGGQHMQPPTPFQHFQNANSSNASPSPVMSEQQFNSQRMQAGSPSPYSPATQTFAPQGTPPQSDYGQRVDTPQSAGMTYPQGQPYNGMGQQSSPPPGSVVNGAQGGPPGQFSHLPPNVQLQQQQRMYEIRQQQMMRQLHQSNNTAQNRFPGSNLNPGVNPANQMAVNQARTQQMQQATMRPNNPEQFMRTLTQFMQQRGMPFNPNPSISGRNVNPMQLYALVMKFGGSKKVSASNQWPTIAASLQYPPVQFPTAAQEIQSYWMHNLGPYESYWWQSLQNQQRQRAMGNQAQTPQHPQNVAMAMGPIQDQFSPTKSVHSQGPDQTDVMNHARRQSNNQFQTPAKQTPPQPQQNGYPMAQPQASQQPSPYAVAQSPHAIPHHPTPPIAQQNLANQSVTPIKKEPPQTSAVRMDLASSLPRKVPMGSEFVPKKEPDLSAMKKGPETHGGIQVGSFNEDADALIRYKPNNPHVHELGIIDIRALTMSLRSGIHAEVRLALDTFASLSTETRIPTLEECEDLVDVLVDCAEDQIELLAEHSAEVSDVMSISPYEEVVRGCRYELESLQDIQEFGTVEYDLDRAADRLICITTILRNFSFPEPNHAKLSDPIVVRFMTTVIRYLGTRTMLLRTYKNTLDFTKDVVVFLSNTSHTIDLPGKEEALCILHFLLSFAPSPSPTQSGGKGIMFSAYNPSLQRYLPCAVDSLAKLLARDDPNRTFYKYIYSCDSASVPSYDVLTRTFGLAIAPIPDYSKCNIVTIDARKPYLAQGMLAAEILVTLIPSSEHNLARSWLHSDDGFAKSLLRLISLLSRERTSGAPRHPQTGRPVDPDPQAYGMLTLRGIAILKKLAEKAKDADASTGFIPVNIIPKKEFVLEALMTRDEGDGNLVRQLCVFAGLDN